MARSPRRVTPLDVPWSFDIPTTLLCCRLHIGLRQLSFTLQTYRSGSPSKPSSTLVMLFSSTRYTTSPLTVPFHTVRPMMPAFFIFLVVEMWPLSRGRKACEKGRGGVRGSGGAMWEEERARHRPGRRP
jgi:hypothetical protein